jgi:putative flavoprotein involved in K+ transport
VNVTNEEIKTVIIGGGHAGLAMSYHLSQLGHEHVILERQRVGDRWRSERWDSLTFQFPNWAMQLPGYPYQGANPDGFAPRDEVVRFIESYAAVIRAPVRCGVSATSLRQRPGSARFLIQTDDAEIEAANVVIATGPYQQPAIPRAIEHAMCGVFQVHSSRYRNSAQLPPGAVLVVGSGNSGCQIAEDLLQGGRRVYLAVGKHRRVPRRYRGRDWTWWWFALGESDQTTDKRPAKKTPRLLTGVDGGHDMDLRRLALDGVVLLGHLLSGQEGKLALAADLGAALAGGDAWFIQFVKSADDYVRQNGLDLPDDDRPREPLPEPKEVIAPILELDLRATGISSVVWATGFRNDFGWVHLPIFVEIGNPPTQEPIHRRGVTDIPGLYFIGLPWLSKLKSSTMPGVGEDAAFLADCIAARS